jgi:hypothetical protein
MKAGNEGAGSIHKVFPYLYNVAPDLATVEFNGGGVNAGWDLAVTAGRHSIDQPGLIDEVATPFSCPRAVGNQENN